jgi:hypothetical protein
MGYRLRYRAGNFVNAGDYLEPLLEQFLIDALGEVKHYFKRPVTTNQESAVRSPDMCRSWDEGQEDKSFSVR